MGVANWGGGQGLQQGVVWSNCRVATEANPFRVPLAGVLFTGRRPCHVSIWQFLPRRVLLCIVGVQKEQPVATERYICVWGRWWLRPPRTGRSAGRRAWRNNAVLCAQHVQSGFHGLVPGVPAGRACGVLLMGPEVGRAAGVNGVVAMEPMEGGVVAPFGEQMA